MSDHDRPTDHSESRAFGGETAATGPSERSSRAPGRIVGLREAALDLLDRIASDDPMMPPDVAPIDAAAILTGVPLLDVGLGGLACGHVHLLVGASPHTRVAVLTHIVVTWAHVRGTPGLLAGPRPQRHLATTVLAATAGVPRTDIAAGDLTPDAWCALTLAVSEGSRLRVLLAGDVRNAADLAAVLDRSAAGEPAVVAVALDDLADHELAEWRALARERALPIVLAVDACAPAARGHRCPELRLSRLADSEWRTRIAADGIGLAGARTRRLILDVDHQTLAMSTYDASNEWLPCPPPSDASLVERPELSWATAHLADP